MAQADGDALNASNPKRPDGAPSKRGSGVPKSDEDIAFSTDMNLGPEEWLPYMYYYMR